jgi:sugar phosphate permease
MKIAPNCTARFSASWWPLCRFVDRSEVNWHTVLNAQETNPALTRGLESCVNGGSLTQRDAFQVVATAFVVLFCVVGLALWGLPFYYDFMVRQFGWTRAQVTSGNALSKLIVGPAFGFIAGWIVDRFGPRRLMLMGILMAGVALAGLGTMSSLSMFYLFYFFNALGYVCGGPLPVQVLLSRWFVKSRGKAMGFACLGIGVGSASVPWISHAMVEHFGWQMALRLLGALIILISFPQAYFVKETPAEAVLKNVKPTYERSSAKWAFRSRPFYLLTLGSVCSIAAVSGTQQNLKLFLSLDRQYSQAEAARVLSLVLTFSIFGRLLMGWLADRFSKKYVMLLTYLLVALGIPFLFLGTTHIAVYASQEFLELGSAAIT